MQNKSSKLEKDFNRTHKMSFVIKENIYWNALKLRIFDHWNQGKSEREIIKENIFVVK